MKKNYLVGYKLFFGLLGFSALVTEVAVLWASHRFDADNFFSYFTVEGNIVAFLVFLASAFFTFAGKQSRVLDMLRGAATFFMVITGILFAVLLSGIEGAEFTAVPWDNAVLHYIIPIAVAIDWISDPPRRISFKKGLLWILFPIAYLFFSLIRGAIVHWYPYPFVNPNIGGYGRVAITSVFILIAGIILVYILTRLSVKAGKGGLKKKS